MTKKQLTEEILKTAFSAREYREGVVKKFGLKLKHNSDFFSSYTQGLLEIIKEHIQEQKLLPEEAVMILLAGAADIQQLYVDKVRIKNDT